MFGKKSRRISELEVIVKSLQYQLSTAISERDGFEKEAEKLWVDFQKEKEINRIMQSKAR